MSTRAGKDGLTMLLPRFAPALRESQRMRLATLTRLRWFSVAGQSAACVFVAWGLWYPYPVFACFTLIALSVALNILLSVSFPRSHRLSPRAAALVLAFDVVQPAGLMFLTGGLTNPFTFFLILPAIVAAATQPAVTVIALAALTLAATSLLAFVHMPLPWEAGVTLALPPIYLGGLWFAIVTSIAFATFYVYRVAAEARALSDALTATELVLQREQHLSALDGLAAAAAHELGTPLATIALVAREMGRATKTDDPMREDIDLLIAQSQRCRDILKRIASLSASSEEHYARLPFTSLIDEVVAPHLGFGIEIETTMGECRGEEPVMRRHAGIVYGLGNIVENAVDFATGRVSIHADWTGEEVRIVVRDDGRGFLPETLSHIGDPYVSGRDSRHGRTSGNLGLGLFIAKTLLERSGARLGFRNRQGARGAEVEIVWLREAFAGAQNERSRFELHGERKEMRSGTDPVPAQ